MSLSFRLDPRLQTLSFQACDLLRRIEEVFARDSTMLDEHGRAPVDAKLLRNLAYPLRRDIRYTHVERGFEELEACGIVTVHESPYGRSFELSEANQLHPHLLPVAMPAPDIFTVIHNSGADPPEQASKNAVVDAAAAAADEIDLMERLRPFFPRHDLKACLKRWMDHRIKRKLALTNQSFARWMQREETPFVKSVPLPPPPKKVVEATQPVITQAEDHPDLFDAVAHKKFLAELKARKLKKAAK